MKNVLENMCGRVLRHTDSVRTDTPIARMAIGVIAHSNTLVTTTCKAGICLVLQGAKQMIVGDRLLRYETGNAFAALIEFPATRSVIEVKEGRPYVATSLTLNSDVISELLIELPSSDSGKSVPAFAVTTMPEDVLDAWDRCLALLDSPGDIPVLGPLRERELLYRLLQSVHGPMLRQIARKEGRLSQVRRTIEWMQNNIELHFPIKELADIASMSIPSFNRNFRAVTSASPLQFHKTLKLQAARRLLAAKANVAEAAFKVGYESVSQFSREYSRLFGVSPRQDAVLMKSTSPTVHSRLSHAV